MAYIPSGYFTNGLIQFSFEEMVEQINRIRPNSVRYDDPLNDVRHVAEILGYVWITRYIPD